MAFIFCKTSLACSPHPDLIEHNAYQKSLGVDVPDYQQLFAEWADKGVNQPSIYDFSLSSYSSGTAGTDTLNVLAILIEFPDQSASTAPEYFDTLIYENRQGCVAHYYLENSYGTLHFTTVTLCSDLGWLTAAENVSYYVDNQYGLGSYPNNAQKLVEEAVDAADAMVDYNDFDNNNDGILDVLMIVHSGTGAELSGQTTDFWSHKWGINTRVRDGVSISTYSMMPEYYLSPGDMTCGVFCHELGHVFGLPDLYDRDYSSRGIGRFSIMAGGSWNGVLGGSPAHFDAWSKVQLGWATEVNVTSTTLDVEIPEVEHNPIVYRLWTSGALGDEYFLVENRQAYGYDAGLNYYGLLIWHVDDAMGVGYNSHDNDDEYYPGHTSSGHFLVALEQADGLWELEKNQSSGNSGDPWPGSTDNRSFTPLTTPNSNDYNDDNTLVAITNISDSDSLMTADFTVSFASAAGDEEDFPLPSTFTLEQNTPNPFNPSTRINYSLPTAGNASVVVYNILGQNINTLVDEFQDAGNYSIEWNGTDRDGRPVSSGIYFYRLTTIDNSESKKMVLIK